MSTSRGRTKKRVKRNRKPGGTSIAPLVINRMRNYVPDRMRTTLRFQKTTVLINGISPFSSQVLIPTFAYDIDPLVGSTAMPGFTELGTLYRKYRVRSSTIQVSFNNEEAFGNLVYVCPTNSSFGANYANYQYFLSNIRSKKVMIGAISGASRANLRASFSVSEFGGVSDVLIDDSYSGFCTGGSPTNNIYWNVGNLGVIAAVSGVFVSIDLQVVIDFYEVTTPAS